MNIKKSIQARWRNGQKGAVLVLTALLLPTLLGISGLAIDFGNMYYQQARLQNAADAAALAGANAYVDSNCTNKSIADNAANEYINGKYNNLETNEPVQVTPGFPKSTNDNMIYYRVTIQKEVPLFFLRLFRSPTTSITAHSTAAINMVDGVGAPLFVFDEQPDLPKSWESPHNYDEKGQIKASYNGSIYTSGNPQNIHSHTNDSLSYFFTKPAVDEQLSINQAKEKKYYHLAKQDATLKDRIEQKVKSLMKETSGTDSHDQNTQSFNVDDANKGNRLQVYESQNLTFNIKGLKKSNTPLIISLPEYGSVAHIFIQEDIQRPIIIYSPGNMKLHIELNGHIFHGVICAPNLSEELLMHTAGDGKYGTFYGTIAAKKIKIHDPGAFYYEDILKLTSSDFSSKSKPTVNLVNDNDIE